MKKMTKTNKIIILLILIGSIYYAIDVIKEKNIYQFLIILTVVPVSLFPYFIKKIGKVKIPDMLESFYMLFIFFAYFLGSIVKFYGKIPCYDNIIHFTSGLLTAFFAYYLFRMWNYNNKSKITSILFIMGLTALIAVSWETFEFTADKISGKDAQYVLKTGVDDTMIDMIMALLGSGLFLFLYFINIKYKRGYMMKRYEKQIKECHGR